MLRMSMPEDSILLASQCARARCRRKIQVKMDPTEAVSASGLAGKLRAGVSGTALLKQAVAMMGVEPSEGITVDADLHIYCSECHAELEATE